MQRGEHVGDRGGGQQAAEPDHLDREAGHHQCRLDRLEL